MENKPLPKIGEEKPLREGVVGHFDHLNGAGEVASRQVPSYRRLGVYAKSIRRYNLERNRRHQVHLLTANGLTQKQIAAELDVSVRTVKRDWKKTKPYVKRQLKVEFAQAQAQEKSELNQKLNVLTLKDEIKLLKKQIRKAAKKKRPLRRLTLRQKQHLIKKLEAAAFNLEKKALANKPK